jgi:hypothetical protein
MGTILLLIFRFVLGYDSDHFANYQLLSLTVSLDTIAFLILISLFKKRQA